MIDLTSPSPEVAARLPIEPQQRLESVRRALSTSRLSESGLLDLSTSCMEILDVIPRFESNESKLCSAFATASISSKQKKCSDLKRSKDVLKARGKLGVHNINSKLDGSDSESDAFQSGISVIAKKHSKKVTAVKVCSKKSEVCEMSLTLDETIADSPTGIHLKACLEEKNISVFEVSFPSSISGLIRW